MDDAAVVAQLDELPVGSVRMVRVDGERLCLVRTADGVHALDHACPHEGYGLTQGQLDGDVLTCAWHNWKFRVSDGACLLGEESVPVHPVTIGVDGSVSVSVHRPTPEELRPRLTASLRRGIEQNYVGQISRDVVRLLRASANPGEVLWEAIAYGAPRSEFGWGHAVASATDCLSMIDLYEGDHRALPLVQGIAGIAEVERGRPVNPLPRPAAVPPEGAATVFRRLIEEERTEDAQALVLGALEAGSGPDELRTWFTGVVSDHLISYGHGAIYTQKAFQLLEVLGWDRADTVLPHLIPTIVVGTREDTLPYMRPFVRALAHQGVDLGALAQMDVDERWSDDGRLLDALLGSDRSRPVDAALAAIRAGAGVDGLLDVVVRAVSERMLRYDVAGERDFHDDFGWLDITHGLTYANAARWLHARSDGTDADHVRLALWCVFLAHWTGRHEWHTHVGPRAEIEPRSDDLRVYGEGLQREALLDGTTAFIVHAHAVKTTVAATEEAVRSGSTVSLDAVARFLEAPKLERFVAANVTRAIDVVVGHTTRD